MKVLIFFVEQNLFASYNNTIIGNFEKYVQEEKPNIFRYYKYSKV